MRGSDSYNETLFTTVKREDFVPSNHPLRPSRTWVNDALAGQPQHSPLHCLVLDGVYRCGADGAPAFVEVGAPTDDELHVLLQTVITRLMKLLTRRGVLIEEMGQTYLAEPDDDSGDARTLRPLQSAAVTYRIAFGPRAGQKMLTLRGARPREATAEVISRGSRQRT